MCLNVKFIISGYTFCTEVSDSINNGIIHGGKKPHQEVGGGL